MVRPIYIRTIRQRVAADLSVLLQLRAGLEIVRPAPLRPNDPPVGDDAARRDADRYRIQQVRYPIRNRPPPRRKSLIWQGPQPEAARAMVPPTGALLPSFSPPHPQPPSSVVPTGTGVELTGFLQYLHLSASRSIDSLHQGQVPPCGSIADPTIESQCRHTIASGLSVSLQ